MMAKAVGLTLENQGSRFHAATCILYVPEVVAVISCKANQLSLHFLCSQWREIRTP